MQEKPQRRICHGRKKDCKDQSGRGKEARRKDNGQKGFGHGKENRRKAAVLLIVQIRFDQDLKQFITVDAADEAAGTARFYQRG